MSWKTKSVPPANGSGFNIVVEDPVTGCELVKIRMPLIGKVNESEMIDFVARIVARAGAMIKERGRPVASRGILNELSLAETATEEEVRGAILALKFPHSSDFAPGKDYDA